MVLNSFRKYFYFLFTTQGYNFNIYLAGSPVGNALWSEFQGPVSNSGLSSSFLSLAVCEKLNHLSISADVFYVCLNVMEQEIIRF